jgi:hypothetical protein
MSAIDGGLMLLVTNASYLPLENVRMPASCYLAAGKGKQMLPALKTGVRTTRLPLRFDT